MTITLTADELARLQHDGELLWPMPMVVRPQSPPCVRHAFAGHTDSCPCPQRVPDPAILAAAEPCETCNGEGCPYCGGREADYHTQCIQCPDCDGYGRKRIEIRVAEPAEHWPGEARYLVGTASVAEVRPVRHNDDEDTPFTCNELIVSDDGILTIGWGPDEIDASRLGDRAALVGSWLAHLTDWKAT